MWKDGLFGEPADSALFAAALMLCIAATLHRAARFGVPRFRGAMATLWLVAVTALPLPLYLSAGVGLWIGAVLFETVRLPASIGAAAGIVLLPPAFLSFTLRVLGSFFTAAQER